VSAAAGVVLAAAVERRDTLRTTEALTGWSGALTHEEADAQPDDGGGAS